MSKSKKKQEFKFKFVYPEDLRDYYVNGAWGGFTPRQEIYVHFYSERQPIPKEITYNVKKSGEIEDVIEDVRGGDIVRLVQSSLVMDVNTAISIRDWLDKMIKAIEDGKKQAKGKKKNVKKGK